MTSKVMRTLSKPVIPWVVGCVQLTVSVVLVLADKPSPSRYVYQYPLYTCGYVTDRMVNEFAAANAERLPVIVDTSSTNAAVPPIDPAARSQWEISAEGCALTPAMREPLEFLEQRYVAEGRLGGTGWTIISPAR